MVIELIHRFISKTCVPKLGTISFIAAFFPFLRMRGFRSGLHRPGVGVIDGETIRILYDDPLHRFKPFLH